MHTDYSYGCIPIREGEHGPEVLLVRRHNGDWNLPKGHREEDESDCQAALRELKEETGISECEMVTEVRFTEKYVYTKDDHHVYKTVVFFPCIVGREQTVLIDGFEVQDYRWLPLHDAIEKATFEEGKNLLRDVDSWLSRLNKLPG